MHWHGVYEGAQFSDRLVPSEYPLDPIWAEPQTMTLTGLFAQLGEQLKEEHDVEAGLARLRQWMDQPPHEQ